MEKYDRMLQCMAETCDSFNYSNITLLFAKALFDAYWFNNRNKPIHEIAVTCMMIASKMHEDNYLSLKVCCDLCGIPVEKETFQKHERHILQFFDFRLHIETPATLTKKWLLKQSISSLHKDNLNKRCNQLLRYCGKGILFSCFEPTLVSEVLLNVAMSRNVKLKNSVQEKLRLSFLEMEK